MEAFREEVLREVEEAVMANGFFAKLPDMTSKDHLAWCAVSTTSPRPLLPCSSSAINASRTTRRASSCGNTTTRKSLTPPCCATAGRRPRTPPPENLISALVREAAVGDKVEALLTINAVGEGVAVFLFSEVVKQFTRNGFENLAYWVMHAQNDEQHSDVFPMIDPESVTAEQLAEYRYRCSYILSCFMSAIESWARL
jgi:hypothetical protein